MGIPVVCLPPLPVADFFSILRPRDLIVAFPLFWQAVFQRYASPSFSLPGELLGLTASAPCPPEVIEGLTQPGRLTAITEIYGSTETSAVGIRSACREPYDLLSLWDRVTLPDGEPGISRIRADGRREAAQAMPDFVEWRGERTFVPVGRKDNAVQVAGVNVYPARVAAIIRAHPAVKDCAVRLMRPEEGARLKAFIVPEETARPLGRKAFGAEFRAWLRERLDTPSFPKSITLGDALPVSSTGKSSDWG
jgi:4-coumarate--CoA ligase (photoactive yellow protein activation family)